MTTTMNAKDMIVTLVFTSPHWLALFFAIAVVVSLALFFVGFLMGLTVGSDVVFGSYALISGVVSYYFIKWKFRRKLVLLTKPEVSFLVLWIVLTLYVIVFRPFE